MLVFWIIGGVMALAPTIYYYIGIYDRLQGKTIDTTNFVTRAELNAMKQERDAQIASTIEVLRSDFAVLKRFMIDDLPALHRALGRLEGHDEAETKTRPRR